MRKAVWHTACMSYLLAVSFYFFDPVLQYYPSVITSQLMQEFTVGAVSVGLIASAYFWSYNLVQIPGGFLCDKVGPHVMLVLAYLLCAAGLLLSWVSVDLNLAILARFIMGLGGGFSTTLLVMISAQHFEYSKLPILIGIGQLMASLGSITGQYGFAWFINQYSWRDVLLTLALIGLVMAIVGVTMFGKHTKPLANSKSFSFKPFLETIKKINNVYIIAYAAFLWGGFALFSGLWGIPYLSLKYDFAMTQASALMAAAALGAGVGSFVIGWLTRFISKPRLLIISALIGIVSAPLIIVLNVNQAVLLVILFIFGLSASGQSLSLALIAEHASQKAQGAMTGVLNTAIMLGPMVLEPFMGWLLEIGWHGQMKEGHPYYSVSDYNKALLLGPLLFLAALFFAVLIYRYYKKGWYETNY